MEVLLASGSVRQGGQLLGLEGLKYLGMDGKSFKGGQSCVTLLSDLEQSRVVDVVEERTTEAAGKLGRSLRGGQKQTVAAVAVDLWEPFIQTMTREVPAAAIVPDKFPISKYLGEAVDPVRREESKGLMAQGDETLKGTRQLWWYNPANFRPEQAVNFAALRDQGLKAARAWAARELFSQLWNYRQEGAARRFFKGW